MHSQQPPFRKRVALAVLGGLTAELFNKIIPLVILRVVVARLGLEPYGRAQFAFWLIDSTVALVTFGYAHVAAVEIGRVRNTPGVIGGIIGEVLTLKLVHAVAAVLLLSTAVLVWPAWQPYAGLTHLLSFLLFTSALDLSFVHVGTSRMAMLSAITVCFKAFGLAATLVFVHGPEDLVVFTLTYFGVNGLIALANFAFNTALYKPTRPALAALARRFRQAIPYAGTALLLTALDRWDMFVVEDLLGASGAGLYSAPVRIAQALGNGVAAMGMVFLAEAVGARDRQELTRQVRLGLWVMWSLTMPLAAGALFTGDAVINLIFGPTFTGLGAVFSTLAAALVAQVLVQAYGLQVLMTKGRVRALNYTLLLGLVVGALLSVTLKESMGMNGVATAALASRVVAGVSLLALGRRHLDQSPWTEFVSTAIPALLMALALLVIQPRGLGPTLITGGGTYLLGLVLFNRSQLAALLRQVRRRIK